MNLLNLFKSAGAGSFFQHKLLYLLPLNKLRQIFKVAKEFEYFCNLGLQLHLTISRVFTFEIFFGLILAPRLF